MGLFGSKNCSICDGKLGLLGGTKLKDGSICKECKKKLSPWFIDYKESEIKDIKEQLEYRKENREKLNSFNAEKVFGEFGAILIDEKNKEFIAVEDARDGLFAESKKITSLNDVIDKNPDIIKFDQIEDINIDIHESKREEKRTENGQQVSYDPKHYTYMYQFTLEIKVKHPYFHYMRITLNSGTIQIYNEGERLKDSIGKRIAQYILDAPELNIQNKSEVYDDKSLKAALLRSEYTMPDYAYGFKCTNKNYDHVQEYGYYLALVREIYNILLEK